jgi:hypothetical protein
MSVLARTAWGVGRRDEVPNQDLARELAAAEDREGIAEVAGALGSKNAVLRSDCIKVLYETGYLAPQLIVPYLDSFLRLLGDRENRMVWGGMIALGTIAPLCAEQLFAVREQIVPFLAKGTVITIDNAVKVLSVVAADRPDYGDQLWPVLERHLATCRAQDVARHAEVVHAAITLARRDDYVGLLLRRMPELSAAQSVRVRRLIKVAQNLRQKPHDSQP